MSERSVEDYLTSWQIPADLFDRGLRDLLLSDHEALDVILTRKCKEMGYVYYGVCSMFVIFIFPGCGSQMLM